MLKTSELYLEWLIEALTISNYEWLCKDACCVDKKLIFIPITLDFNRIHCKIAENHRS